MAITTAAAITTIPKRVARKEGDLHNSRSREGSNRIKVRTHTARAMGDTGVERPVNTKEGEGKGASEMEGAITAGTPVGMGGERLGFKDDLVFGILISNGLEGFY